MNIIELIKKHKSIVVKLCVGLLVIFSLNRCTVACNRGRSLERYENTSGATIDSLTKETAELKNNITLLCKDTAYLRGIISDLNSKNAVLVEKSTKAQIVHNHYKTKE